MSAGIKSAKVQQYAAGGAMPGSGSFRAIPQGMPMGDPGIFGSIWGGIKGAVGGALTGNPLNIVGGAISGAFGERKSVMSASPRLPAPVLMAPTLMPIPRNQQGTAGYSPPVWNQGVNGAQGRPKPGIVGFGQRLIPGGETGYYDEYQQRAGQRSSIGYHWNKSGYFLKDGSWIAAGTKEVKNRRRNSLNPRALDRALQRVTSAKKASKKIGRVSIRKAPSCK